jgi:GAF domain-containing protein
LGIPLIFQDQVIGVLNLDKDQPGYYQESDLELAMAFANQAAIAIENARMYESRTPASLADRIAFEDLGNSRFHAGFQPHLRRNRTGCKTPLAG